MCLLTYYYIILLSIWFMVDINWHTYYGLYKLELMCLLTYYNIVLLSKWFMVDINWHTYYGL